MGSAVTFQGSEIYCNALLMWYVGHTGDVLRTFTFTYCFCCTGLLVCSDVFHFDKTVFQLPQNCVPREDLLYFR